MRHKWIVVVLAAFLAVVAGCFGGGGSSPPAPAGAVRVGCVDLANGGPSGRCAGSRAALSWVSSAHAADQETDAGTLTRSQAVSVTSRVDNLTPAPFSGYISAKFDAGCNGAAEWEILPKQAIDVPAGEQVALGVSGSCGDMPAGSRTLTAVAYGPDGETVVDRVIVRFNLTE